jgi:hypothetical protein
LGAALAVGGWRCTFAQRHRLRAPMTAWWAASAVKPLCTPGTSISRPTEHSFAAQRYRGCEVPRRDACGGLARCVGVPCAETPAPAQDCYPSTWSAAVAVAAMLRGLVKQHARSGVLPPMSVVVHSLHTLQFQSTSAERAEWEVRIQWIPTAWRCISTLRWWAGGWCVRTSCKWHCST